MDLAQEGLGAVGTQGFSPAAGLSPTFPQSSSALWLLAWIYPTGYKAGTVNGWKARY